MGVFLRQEYDGIFLLLCLKFVVVSSLIIGHNDSLHFLDIPVNVVPCVYSKDAKYQVYQAWYIFIITWGMNIIEFDRWYLLQQP